MGLCLSGGGFRAMLFHAGAIWRLKEAGLLQRLDRISSVSGGSITAALLGMSWNEVAAGSSAAYEHLVVEPLRSLASQTLDAEAVIVGALFPGTIADRVAGAYRSHLYGSATLQDLPDRPRFIVNATNVQSAALWRFSKRYMRDWRVGEVKAPKVELAVAVAASSAFPPILSPLTLDLDPSAFTPGSGTDLQKEPYTQRAVLTDGGVYDNLGLETVWKRCATVLVSDAGAKLKPQGTPREDWARHALRVLDIIDDQGRNLRKRQLIDSYLAKTRGGAYWGIRSQIAKYGGGGLSCPPELTQRLAAIPTRLSYLPDGVQEKLINWGYAIADAALRTHVDTTLPPGDFPYPGGVGDPSSLAEPMEDP